MKTHALLFAALVLAACHEGPPGDTPKTGADAEAPKPEHADADVPTAAGDTCTSEVGCAAGLRCVIAPCAVAPCTNGSCQKM